MNLRKKFRALMSGKRLVLMPGAYDGLSARIMEAEGFEALCAGGYAAIGSMMAQADMGQSNMRDYADHYARICGAVEIPVFVDADTGFGGVNNVRQMIRAFEAAGVAGMFFSDQVFPNRCGYLPGKQVIPAEQMLAKIKAALDARRDPDFFIAARTDAAAVNGLDDAIDRARAYADAGADLIFPEAMAGEADFERLRAAIDVPILANMTEFGKSPLLTTRTLENLGVNVVIYPVTLLRLAMHAADTGLAAIAGTGTQEGLLDQMQHRRDLYDLLD